MKQADAKRSKPAATAFGAESQNQDRNLLSSYPGRRNSAAASSRGMEMAKDEQQDIGSLSDSVNFGGGWVKYFQVVGCFSEGEKLVEYALSRELPTRAQGDQALIELHRQFPDAGARLLSCAFDFDAGDDGNAEFVQFLYSDQPFDSPSRIRGSWQTSEAKRAADERAAEEAEHARYWKAVEELPFVKIQRGRLKSYWKYEPGNRGDVDQYAEGQDHAFAIIALVKQFPGRKYLVNRMLKDIFCLGRVNFDSRMSGFFDVMAQTVVSASNLLDFDKWHANIRLRRESDRTLLADIRAEAAKKRSNRARHAALCRHRKNRSSQN